MHTHQATGKATLLLVGGSSGAPGLQTKFIIKKRADESRLIAEVSRRMPRSANNL
jgi:hypothetical protein